MGKLKICQRCKEDYSGRVRSLIDEDNFINNEELCILHSKNIKKDIEIFENSLTDVIEEINKSVEKEIQWDAYFFNLIYFPKDFQFNLFFSKIIKNNLNLIFSDCTFYDIKFSNDKCENLLEFKKCKIENIKVENFVFEGKFKLKNSEIIDRASFESCKFNKLADFYGTIFEMISFKDSRFYKMTVFSEVTIKLGIDFRYTYFFDIAHFREMILKNGSLDFSATTFDKAANFLNMKSNNRKDIQSGNIANRETARIIKNSFEQQNNIIEANKFYALEMKEREKELEIDMKEGKNFFEWFVFKIHGLSSNHSQDWILALFWIINITFSLFITEKNIGIFGFNFISFIPSLSMIVLGINVAVYNDNKIRTIFLFIISFINFGVFKIISEEHSLDCIAEKINPFSIMTELSQLNFETFIYKIIIAYLIYQLIISIRQNTRRK